MKLRLPVLIALCASLPGVTAYAHHSFAGTYALDQHATIDGKISEIQFRNPHTFVTLDVTDKDGKTTRWGIEWGSAMEMSQMGVTPATLKVGDQVSITGAPPKDATQLKVLMQKIVRPSDGWSWEGRFGQFYNGN